MPNLVYDNTFDESGLDGKQPQSWDNYVSPYFKNIRTLLNTTGLDAVNLGVTAGQVTASKALVVDASRNLADGTAGNQINNLTLSGTFTCGTVAITGGSIAGITDLAIADGGTGASTAAAARTNLGLAIGSDVQAYDAELQALSGLTPTDGNFIVGNGSTFVTEDAATSRTSLGLGSIATQASNSVSITGGSVTGITDVTVADGGTGASDAAGARTNLGLVIGTNVQAYDAGLADIAGLATSDGNIIVGSGSNWVAESGATARTSLGLGSIATQASDSVSITGGSVTGITDITVADGGTGSSSASGARTNLGVAIGSDVQAYDAGLAAIAGLAVTDGNIIVGNGSTWVAESAGTARTSLGLGSIATQAADNVSISGGSLTGMTSYSGGSFSGTTGTFSGNVTLSKDAPYLIMTDSGTGGGTSKIAVDAIGSNYGFYFQADGSTNHVILESNGNLKVDTDTLFVDSVNDKVGFSEANPDTIIHATQGGEPPAEGMLILEANSSSRQLRIQPPTNADNGFFDARGGNMTFLDDGTEIWRYNASTFSTSSDINVGIGTASPQTTMHIVGDFDASATYGTTNPNKGFQINKKSGTSSDYSHGDSFGIDFTSSSDDNNTYPVAGVYAITTETASYNGGELHFLTKQKTDSNLLSRVMIDKGGGLKVLGQNLTHSTNALSIGQEGSGLAQFRAYGPDTSNRGSIEFVTDLSNGTASVRHITLKDVSGSAGVGVGTQTPLARVHTALGTANLSSVTSNTQAVFEHTAAAGSVSRVAIIGGQGSGYSVLDFADTTRSGYTDNGNITYNHTAERMTFATDVGTTRIAVDSDGLKFGTDTAAANALDDYEQGTHNPTVTCSTSGTMGLESTRDTLQYTKIGNWVNVQGYVEIKTVSSGVGHVKLSMPFANQNDSEYSGISMGSIIVNASSNPLNCDRYSMFMQQGSSEVKIYATDGGVQQNDSAENITTAGGADLYLNISYRTQ